MMRLSHWPCHITTAPDRLGYVWVCLVDTGRLVFCHTRDLQE